MRCFEKPVMPGTYRHFDNTQLTKKMSDRFEFLQTKYDQKRPLNSDLNIIKEVNFKTLKPMSDQKFSNLRISLKTGMAKKRDNVFRYSTDLTQCETILKDMSKSYRHSNNNDKSVSIPIKANISIQNESVDIA